MPIITISRGICSGGTQVAELLHAKLGWPILGQEETSKAAAKAYRMTEEELLRGLYLPANLYERFTQRKTRYLLATSATITEVLGDGNGIYHGLAGQFLFQQSQSNAAQSACWDEYPPNDTAQPGQTPSHRYCHYPTPPTCNTPQKSKATP